MKSADTQINRSSQVREIVQRYAERVYRYQLARRGNEREAEYLTRKTFEIFFRSYPFKQKIATGSPDEAVRLFNTAIIVQSSHRHGRDTASLADAAPDQIETLIFQRAQLASLVDFWSTIPSFQVEVLSLACFAGLNGSEIEQVTRRDPDQIHAILAAQDGLCARLRTLSEGIHLTSTTLNRLLSGLEASALHSQKNTDLSLSRFSIWLNRLAYHVTGLAQRRSVRLSTAGLAGALIGLVLFMTFHSPAVPAATQVTDPSGSSSINTFNTFYPPGQPDLGVLTPPDQATCQRWQNSLTQLLGATAPLALIDNQPILDPNGQGPSGAGVGCYIDLNPDGQPFRINLQRLAGFFNSQGFQRETQADNPCNKATPPPTSSLYSFTRCYFQSGSSWINLKLQQKIVLEYTNFRGLYAPDSQIQTLGQPPNSGPTYPPTPAPTRIGEPTAPTATPGTAWRNPYFAPFNCSNTYSEAPCDPSLAAQANRRRQVVLRLGVANLTTVPVINGFISQWSAGNPGAVGYLTPDLRRYVPDLGALDRLAGILRRPDLNVKVTWQTVNNSGSTLLLEAFVDESSTLALPGLHQGPIQVLLSQVKGQWWISGVGQLF